MEFPNNSQIHEIREWANFGQWLRLIESIDNLTFYILFEGTMTDQDKPSQLKYTSKYRNLLKLSFKYKF